MVDAKEVYLNGKLVGYYTPTGDDEYETFREKTKSMAMRKVSLTPEQDTLKLKRLRLLIKEGIDEIDRGDYTEVDDKDLDAYLDSLAEEAAFHEKR